MISAEATLERFKIGQSGQVLEPLVGQADIIEIQAFQIGQPGQIGKPRVRRGAVPEIEVFEFGQTPECALTPRLRRSSR